MTNEELPAGRDLDAMVAQTMGWREVRIPWHADRLDGSCSVMWYRADGAIVVAPPVFVWQGATNLPMFSTEISHAWIAAEWLRERFPDFQVASGWDREITKPWHVTWGFDGMGWNTVEADTPAHAICLAVVHSWNKERV
jgi:hypothetical protein